MVTAREDNVGIKRSQQLLRVSQKNVFFRSVSRSLKFRAFEFKDFGIGIIFLCFSQRYESLSSGSSGPRSQTSSHRMFFECLIEVSYIFSNRQNRLNKRFGKVGRNAYWGTDTQVRRQACDQVPNRLDECPSRHFQEDERVFKTMVSPESLHCLHGLDLCLKAVET
ncbi:hypothetical protein Bealeia2_01894 (plasmid) [Candidatus Bealeia paramacronuclearis]|nr:hypothetical protein [Candidatus Bealeia paramacronuclearis]